METERSNFILFPAWKRLEFKGTGVGGCSEGERGMPQC